MSGPGRSCRSRPTTRTSTRCTAKAARSRRETADAVNAARARGGRIVAVGTTSLRLLESAAAPDGKLARMVRRDRHLHHARLPLPGRRCADDQFPPAALDAVHAGVGLFRPGDDARGLCACDRQPAIASIPMATRACCFTARDEHGRRSRRDGPPGTGRRGRTASAGIREHRDQTGHGLCWHHPDLWSLLPEKTEPSIAVPPWPKFMRGCVRYRQSLDEQAPARRSTTANMMTDAFTFRLIATDGTARRGEISMPRGDIRTPAFMPVGTGGTVKAHVSWTRCAQPAPTSSSATPII